MHEFKISEQYLNKKKGTISRSLYLHVFFLTIAVFLAVISFRAGAAVSVLFLLFGLYVFGTFIRLLALRNSIGKGNYLETCKLYEDRIVLSSSDGRKYISVLAGYLGWMPQKGGTVTLIPKPVRPGESLRRDNFQQKKIAVKGLENTDQFISILSESLPRVSKIRFFSVLRILMIPVYFLLFSVLIQAGTALTGFLPVIAVIFTFAVIIIIIVTADSWIKCRQYRINS